MACAALGGRHLPTVICGSPALWPISGLGQRAHTPASLGFYLRSGHAGPVWGPLWGLGGGAVASLRCGCSSRIPPPLLWPRPSGGLAWPPSARAGPPPRPLGGQRVGPPPLPALGLCPCCHPLPQRGPPPRWLSATAGAGPSPALPRQPCVQAPVPPSPPPPAWGAGALPPLRSGVGAGPVGARRCRSARQWPPHPRPRCPGACHCLFMLYIMFFVIFVSISSVCPLSFLGGVGERGHGIK